MTTELERYSPAGIEAVMDPTGGRLVAWAAGLSAAHTIGKALCTTTFAPKHFQGKPEEAAAAILYGDELGLTPTQALRSIYVVSGTPALYARVMVALVQSHGHQIWTDEDSPSKVTVCGRRRGTEHVERSTWTTERARIAGYTSNQKYKTDPQAMLRARASGDVARMVAADALLGIAYTVEEMELEQSATVTMKREAGGTTAKRTAKRAAPKAEPVEPDLDEDTEAPAAQGEVLISAEQSAKLHACLADLGIGNRDAGLAYAADVLKRPVETTKTFTVEEASLVIDALEADIAANTAVAEPELDEDAD